MGALPIVLALSGFVLLWAIVNYNSFKDKSNAIQQMLGLRAELLRQRTDILKKLADLFRQYGASVPVYFNELLNDPARISAKPLIESALSQLNTSAQMYPALLKADEFKVLKNSLVTNTNQLLKQQNSLTALINYYNKQTTSMPYRIVATVFGFKPVKGI
jgi:hypothetical protein